MGAQPEVRDGGAGSRREVVAAWSDQIAEVGVEIAAIAGSPDVLEDRQVVEELEGLERAG